MPDASPTVGRPWRDPRGIGVALAGLGALAFVLRLISVLRGGGLLGWHGFDDGVYFGAAVAATEGSWPYRDFVFLHPPGIVVLLAPFAVLGRSIGDLEALGVARLVFIGLGAVNTALVGLVALPYGRVVAAAAATVYAVWSVAAAGEHTIGLVAPQTTLGLLAYLALAPHVPERLDSRRAALAGAAMGLGVTLKLWMVFPAVMALVWLLTTRLRGRTHGARHLIGAYVLGGLLAAGLVVLPFLVAVGRRFVLLVVEAQLARVGPEGPDVTGRALALLGVPDALTMGGPGVGLGVALGLGAAAALGALAVGRRRPGAGLIVGILAAKAVILVALSPVFFASYAPWIAPELAVLVGIGVAVLLGRSRGWRRSIVIAAIGLAAVGLAFATTQSAGSALAVDRHEPDLAHARCVVADAPTLLLMTDTLRRDLERGCAVELDPTGLSHVLNAENPGPYQQRTELPAYQEAMRTYFGTSDAALFIRLQQTGLTAETRAAIRDQLPYVVNIGDVLVRLRSEP